MHVHKGIDNRVLGRIHSDEEFTIRIQHVMKLKSKGYPVNYYTDKYNRVRVLRNGSWWVIDRIAEYEKIYDWTLED